MKICFIGAGAVGSYLAAHLARQQGIEVSVVARGENLKAIAENGIKVVSSDGEFTAPVRAVSDTSVLGVQDYVFITLKQDQILSVLPSLKPLLGPATAVLSPTTGLPYWYFYGHAGQLAGRTLPRSDPGGQQWKAIGPERALGCVYWIGAQRIAPGVVRRHGAVASFPIGEPDGTRSPRLLRLHEVMRAGGIDAPISTNIRTDLWQKMISSMVWNSLAMLTTAMLGQIARAPDVVAVAHRVTGEAEQAASALGIHFATPKETRIATTLAMLAAHRMSMLQDFDNGRRTEIQVFIDTMADVHEAVDAPTPLLDSLLALVALRLSVAGLHDLPEVSQPTPAPATWWASQSS